MAPSADVAQAATLDAALRAATARLAAAGGETPRLDAEVLLRHLLGIDRTALFLRRGEAMPAGAGRDYAALIDRRLAGEPVAYLTNEREFMGLPMLVTPAVLIPRPETEILVEWAIAWLRGRPTAGARVLDVGTGSGAIILSLAHHLGPASRATLIGGDVAADTLSIAAANRERLGLGSSVALVRGDLAGWCRGPLDLLLANLPYLRPDQIAANPALAAEPAGALAGGADGLDLIRRLIADLPRLLAPAAALGLEIDPAQAEMVAHLVRRALPRASISILSDLAGLARHVVATT